MGRGVGWNSIGGCRSERDVVVMIAVYIDYEVAITMKGA